MQCYTIISMAETIKHVHGTLSTGSKCNAFKLKKFLININSIDIYNWTRSICMCKCFNIVCKLLHFLILLNNDNLTRYMSLYLYIKTLSLMFTETTHTHMTLQAFELWTTFCLCTSSWIWNHNISIHLPLSHQLFWTFGIIKIFQMGINKPMHHWFRRPFEQEWLSFH